MRHDLFELQDPDAIRTEVRSIGGSAYKVLIADNVFRHPDAIRDFGLSAAYSDRRRTFPCGLMADGLMVALDLARLIRAELAPAPFDEQSPLAFCSFTSKSTDTHHLMSTPHVDNEFNMIAVVYLNRQDDCHGGTGFYRHDATGAISVADPPPDVIRSRVAEGDDWTNAFWDVFRDELDPTVASILGVLSGEETAAVSGWTMIDKVEMRFNRMVAFDPRVFHKPWYAGQEFGEELERRRLIARACFKPSPSP